MIPVSFTGFTGYFIYDPEISARIILVTLGILLMAIAASVMNQMQEVDIDAKMKRTSNRPLPKGRIGLMDARIWFFFTLFSGTVLLSAAGNLSASLTGLFTVLWYNGVYTNAKRLTPYAIIPGALTGALPPLIGWVAAGGGFFDKTIIFIELLFFIGQIPHFLLLTLKYGEEYQNAGIPVLSGIMSSKAMRRTTFVLVITAAAIALYLSHFELGNPFLVYICLFASVILILQFSGLLKKKEDKNRYSRYFHSLDIYFLLVLILLISDKAI